MRAPDDVERDRRASFGWWIAVAGALAGATLGAGCRKSASESQVPAAGSLAEYETLLARNASDLEAAGIVVARADTSPGGAGIPRVTDPSPPKGDASADQASEREASEELGPPAPMEPAPEAEASPPPSDAPMSADDVERRTITPRASRAKKKSNRCERICDLAEIACELEARICDLADTHPDDPRYASACTRAADQCELASNACTRCD